MTAIPGKPLVSVGVLAYNEARFIRETLSSLLAQDYPNIEIIIGDNCSSDDTGSICQEFASVDSRVRYTRHAQNIGVGGNTIYVLNEASGKFFMWAAGHDLWDSNLISTCVEALESHPNAAIAYGPTDWIDADGHQYPKESGWYDTRGMGPLLRFFFAFFGNLHPILGVIRADYLRTIKRFPTCVGADQILLVDLALRGDFIFLCDTKWSRRQPRIEESHKDKMKRYTGNEFRMANSWIDRRFPLLRLPFEQIRSIVGSALGVLDKLALVTTLFPAFIVRYLAGRTK